MVQAKKPWLIDRLYQEFLSQLCLNNQWNEFVLTRLRTYKGIEIQEIEQQLLKNYELPVDPLIG
jgi:hypothetical protein